MIVIIAILLALVPAIAIIYPFFKGRAGSEYLEDESAPQAELQRRWDAVVAGLKSAELERAIGSLEEGDYRWLRQRYMTDAARIIRAMELEQEQEAELQAAIQREIEAVRLRVLGPNGVTRHGESEAEATHTLRPSGEEADA